MGLMSLGAITAGASAAEPRTPGVAVRYSDLDLGTAAGAERLYERLQVAAQQVCPQVSSQELSRYMATKRCEAAVVANAVSRIKSPQLAAIYVSRTHHGLRSPV